MTRDLKCTEREWICAKAGYESMVNSLQNSRLKDICPEAYADPNNPADAFENQSSELQRDWIDTARAILKASGQETTNG